MNEQYAIDPEVLAQVDLEDWWFAGLSEPIQETFLPVMQVGKFIAFEAEAAEDEFYWRGPFSEPVRDLPLTPGHYVIDPDVLLQAEAIELGWFVELGTPPRVLAGLDAALQYMMFYPEPPPIGVTGPPRHRGFTRNVGKGML